MVSPLAENAAIKIQSRLVLSAAKKNMVVDIKLIQIYHMVFLAAMNVPLTPVYHCLCCSELNIGDPLS